jgi:2-oxoisovalerate ferredoxin oxidoreductase delta subunit
MSVEPAPRTPRARPKPFLFPQLCKACGRCIEVCPKDCIELGTEIEPSSGFTPVTLDLELCNGCGLCLTACPEPYGLLPIPLGEERAPGIRCASSSGRAARRRRGRSTSPTAGAPCRASSRW